MPPKGCPLPKNKQVRCGICPLSNMEKIHRCRWYERTLHGLRPERINTISNGILLFSFSIVVLSQKTLTHSQATIAYISMVISIALAICALLPTEVEFLSNSLVYGGINSFALMAWFFTFSIDTHEQARGSS